MRKRRNERALCSCFATKLLGLLPVVGNTSIDEPLREKGVVFPAVDVRSDAVIINVSVAAFRHSQKACRQSLRDTAPWLKALLLALLHHLPSPLPERTQLLQVPDHFGLNFHMYENEPLFIHPAKKILQKSDIAEFDRGGCINTLPVMKCIGIFIR